MARALHNVITKSGGPVNDRIMEQKQVLVTWNQADTTRRQITKLSHFVEAGRSNSSISHETLEQPTRHGIRLRTHNAYP
jgi:hypothetical protein